MPWQNRCGVLRGRERTPPSLIFFPAISRQIDFHVSVCCIKNPVACMQSSKVMFIDKLLCLTKTMEQTNESEVERSLFFPLKLLVFVFHVFTFASNSWKSYTFFPSEYSTRYIHTLFKYCNGFGFCSPFPCSTHRLNQHDNQYTRCANEWKSQKNESEVCFCNVAITWSTTHHQVLAKV